MAYISELFQTIIRRYSLLFYPYISKLLAVIGFETWFEKTIPYIKSLLLMEGIAQWCGEQANLDFIVSFASRRCLVYERRRVIKLDIAIVIEHVVLALSTSNCVMLTLKVCIRHTGFAI